MKQLFVTIAAADGHHEQFISIFKNTTVTDALADVIYTKVRRMDEGGHAGPYEVECKIREGE
jgi:hypothetical protein